MKFCLKGCLWDHHQPDFQGVQILQLQGYFEEIPLFLPAAEKEVLKCHVLRDIRSPWLTGLSCKLAKEKKGRFS